MIHVNVFSELLVKDMSESYESWANDGACDRIIDDFVFLMIFCGNDFMPQIPFLNIASNCIQLMINAYCELLEEEHRFITADNKPDLGLLQLILKKVKIVEETTFLEKTSDYITSLLSLLDWERDAQQKETLKQEIKNCGDFSHYRKLYYRMKLGIDVEGSSPSLSSRVDEAAMTRLCSEYFKGLCWVLRYYNDTVPSWSWIFPYHYTAFASDLARWVTYASVAV